MDTQSVDLRFRGIAWPTRTSTLLEGKCGRNSMKTVTSLMMLCLLIAPAAWAEVGATSTTAGTAGANAQLVQTTAVGGRFGTVDADGNGMVTLLDIGRAVQRRISKWMSGSADENHGNQLAGAPPSQNASPTRMYSKGSDNMSNRLRREEAETDSLRQAQRNDGLTYVVPNLFNLRF